MTERAARVAVLWGQGFPVGPEPATNCTTCSHNWGGHQLHLDFDDASEGVFSGRWSCPEDNCLCVGTWATGWEGNPETHPCDFGRKLIKTDAPPWECPREGSHNLTITDDESNDEEVWLCDSHVATIRTMLE